MQGQRELQENELLGVWVLGLGGVGACQRTQSPLAVPRVTGFSQAVSAGHE